MPAVGSATRPRPEDFGILAYAYGSAVSTATALRSIGSHPFLRALQFQGTPEALAEAAPAKANGQVAERVRVSFGLPGPRSELPPRQLLEEALATIVGMGRWRAELRRDETFFAQELTLPAVRGDAALQSGHRVAEALTDGVVNTAPQGSLLCVWDPVETVGDESLVLRGSVTGQRLSQLLGERSVEVYERARGSNRLADRLLVVMAESFGRVAKADIAARMLKTSERTMRRRLAAEQTSFQQVLDQFRAALAKDFLSATNLPTQLIGELLGFTEATNFRRAFIRWAGESPHQFRRRAGAAH
ncbi:MAG: helix-turn-helix domain-containing protein [Pseudomonadota bacterium]